MPNGTYGGVGGRKTEVDQKILLPFTTYPIAVCLICLLERNIVILIVCNSKVKIKNYPL